MAADHFQTGIFANTLPGELFQSYLCVGCGLRAKTWAAFKAHRTAGCSERLWATPPVAAQAERARPDRVEGGFSLTVDDLDHLAALAAQVDPAG